jgi:hypothetical protein
MTNPELRSFEPPEIDSLGSEGSSDESNCGESQSLGVNLTNRSVRNRERRRSVGRSKSSRASRRTNTTVNSMHGGTEQKNNNENDQKKILEPVYLN